MREVKEKQIYFLWRVTKASGYFIMEQRNKQHNIVTHYFP